MKAITLWQPWASAIMLGHKNYETRSWSTGYRGEIAIHSAKRWTAKEKEYADFFKNDCKIQGFDDLPLGCLIGTAVLTEIKRTDFIVDLISEKEEIFGNYAPGRFAWKLERIRKFKTPIPYKGKQGLFEVPDIIFEDDLFE